MGAFKNGDPELYHQRLRFLRPKNVNGKQKCLNCCCKINLSKTQGKAVVCSSGQKDGLSWEAAHFMDGWQLIAVRGCTVL